MSRGVARLGDRTFGTCSAHPVPLSVGGKIITARTDVLTNNRGTARLGDTVLTDCGHTSKIITASATVETGGRSLKVARLGDKVGDGPYSATIITASSNVFPNQ